MSFKRRVAKGSLVPSIEYVYKKVIAPKQYKINEVSAQIK
jgi:hypothetical protein